MALGNYSSSLKSFARFVFVWQAWPIGHAQVHFYLDENTFHSILQKVVPSVQRAITHDEAKHRVSLSSQERMKVP